MTMKAARLEATATMALRTVEKPVAGPAKYS